MSFDKGFNFRSTGGFVTDGTNEFPVFKSTAYSAPQGYGWTTAPTGNDDDRDRSAGTDRRLAGINFTAAAGLPRVFRLDLPSAGQYGIRLAVGDFSNSQNWKVVIKDGSTTKLTISGTTSGAAQFFDASGVDRSAAAWPANNVLVGVTFAGTICNVEIQDNGGVNSGLAHFSITDAVLTSGSIEMVTTARTLVQAIVDPATGGAGGYTYQWYRSTSSGFTPGGGNILSGKTTRLLCDYTPSPNTAYFYKCVVTDSGAATATSSELAVTTNSGASSLEAGFTQLNPAAATICNFVSSSGNDSNDGLMPSRAKATIAAGVGLLRTGQPDWLLIKRGDTFTEVLSSAWTKSGVSSGSKMVVWTYGTSFTRPLLKCGTVGVIASSGTPDFLHFRGFEASAHTRIPGGPDFTGTTGDVGVNWASTGTTSVIFEDLYVHHFETNFVLNPASSVTGIQVLRCIATDSYATVAHSQGIYNAEASGTIVQECVLDHNGWHDTQAGANATVFNHGIYVSGDSTAGHFTSNIISRCSATGIKGGSGGYMEGNVFIDNPIAITFGALTGGNASGYWGDITNTYIEGSATIDGSPRGYAIAVVNVTSGIGKGLLIDNVIFNGNSDADVQAWAIWLAGAADPGNAVGVNQTTISNCISNRWFKFMLVDGTLVAGGSGQTALNGLTVSSNVAFSTVSSSVIDHDCAFSSGQETFSGNKYSSVAGLTFSIQTVSKTLSEWKIAIEASASSVIPGYMDTSRNIASYSTSIGGAGTVVDFLTQCKLQGWGNWRTAYTAAAVLTYIQAGYAINSQPLTAAVIYAAAHTSTHIRISASADPSYGTGTLNSALVRALSADMLSSPTTLTSSFSSSFDDVTVVQGTHYYYRLHTTDDLTFVDSNVVSAVAQNARKNKGGLFSFID